MRRGCGAAGRRGLGSSGPWPGAGAPADNDPAARHAPSVAQAIRSGETHVSPSETLVARITAVSRSCTASRGVGAVAVLDAQQFVAQPHGHRARCPLAHRPFALRADTLPTGVITAAVPQAKTSVSSPDVQPSCHCVTDHGRLLGAGTPRSGPSLISVVPGDAGQQGAGQRRGDQPAVRAYPYTKNRFIPPISSTKRCSSASSQTTWSQPCATASCCAGEGGRRSCRRTWPRRCRRARPGALLDSQTVTGPARRHGSTSPPGEAMTQNRYDSRRPVHPQPRLGRDHEGPHVQAAPRGRGPSPGPARRAVRWPATNSSAGSSGMASALAEPVEPGGVGLRPERPISPSASPVRLQALEDLLRVVEDRRRRLQAERAAGPRPASCQPRPSAQRMVIMWSVNASPNPGAARTRSRSAAASGASLTRTPNSMSVLPVVIIAVLPYPPAPLPGARPNPP